MKFVHIILAILIAIAVNATADDGLVPSTLGLDVVKILGLGVIGLGFLLALLAYRLLDKIQSQPDPNHSSLRSIYLFMLFSVILCIIGFGSQVFDQRRSLAQSEEELNQLQAKFNVFLKSRERLSKVSGKIVKPEGGQNVKSTFPCTGTIASFSEGEGLHIWLAVEIDGFMWPRDRPLQVGQDGRWSTTVYEDGTGSKFSLILIAADEAAHAKIQEWLVRGQSDNGKFERMSTIEGIVRLDRVDNLGMKRQAMTTIPALATS